MCPVWYNYSKNAVWTKAKVNSKQWPGTRDQATLCLNLDTDEIECCNFLNDQSLEPSI